MVLFPDREAAGEALAEKLIGLKERLENPIVLGIPRGGLPIGFCVAAALGCPLDVIVLRKLPIPADPEAGFGAVTLDRVAIFNEVLTPRLFLTKRDIDRIIERVYEEVLRRNEAYRKDRPFPSLKGRSVILADDGLASGYTMMAAVKFARSRGAKEIIASAPVAHCEAYRLVKKEADEVVVLHISVLAHFAVASFYREFPDMSDREVISYLEGKPR